VQRADLRTRLGRAGREHVLPRFGVDGYVRSVSSLYERLLAQHGFSRRHEEKEGHEVMNRL
jgi:hypothetical protein